MRIEASDIRAIPTISQGQCCDLKIDNPLERVWHCRVQGGITVERYSQGAGRWYTHAGGCNHVRIVYENVGEAMLL